MLSRTICAPRICLSCRIGLARQRASAAQRYPSQLLISNVDGRRFKSRSSKNADDKLVVQSKERIESLLRGETALKGDKPAPKNTKPARKDSGPSIQEIAKSLVDSPVEYEEQPDVSFMDPKYQRRPPKTKPYVPYYKEQSEAPELRQKREVNEDIRPDLDRYWADEENNGAAGQPQGSEEPRTTDATAQPSARKSSRRKGLISHRKLDIDALGRPVDALVLENPNRLSSGTSKPLYMPTGESNETDWAALSTFEVSEDPAGDADRNIEEMRPADNGAVGLKTFQKLRASLVDSYTRDQLHLYIQARQARKRSLQQKPDLLPWLKREQPWKSGTTSDTARLTPKAKLATTILRDVWGVDILDDVIGVGVHTMGLKESLFKLLSRTFTFDCQTCLITRFSRLTLFTEPTTGAMKYITAGLLDKSNGETIKLDHSESEMHVHTRKSAIPAIKSRIDDVANAMVRKKARLTKLERSGVNQAVLDELGRITQAAVHYTANAPVSTASFRCHLLGHRQANLCCIGGCRYHLFIQGSFSACHRGCCLSQAFQTGPF